jgi:hypothetical protein
MKITNDLTNLTTAILILTVQMFIEWTLVNTDRQCLRDAYGWLKKKRELSEKVLSDFIKFLPIV